VSGPMGFGAPIGGAALPAGITLLGAAGVGSVGEAVTSDPSVAGLKRAPGTIVAKSDGSAAWCKTGTANTAWTLISAAPGPFLRMNSDAWYVWGKPANLANYETLSLSGNAMGPNLVEHGMLAVPHIFPEAGTITRLGLIEQGANVPSPRDCGWVGIARNKLVAGAPYPDVTLTGSAVQFLQPTGIATGGTIYLQQAAVPTPVSVAAGEMLWSIYQIPTLAPWAGGDFLYGGDSRDFLSSQGLYTVTTQANQVIAQSTLAQFVGWDTGLVTGTTYTVESSFPAGGRQVATLGPNVLVKTTTAFAQSFINHILFQWERS
jgi:hypothetical protein